MIDGGKLGVRIHSAHVDMEALRNTNIHKTNTNKALENNIFEAYILYLKDGLEHLTFLKVTVWQKYAICTKILHT